MTHGGNVDFEAAMWWLKMKDVNLSPETVEEFQRWVRASSEHELAYVRAMTTWRRSGELKASYATQLLQGRGAALRTAADRDLQSWRVWAQSSRPAGVRARLRYWRIATFCACILLLAGAPAWLALDMPRWTSYEAQIGEHQKEVLGDGSILHLNTDTVVRVRVSDSRREIQLVRGEALFTVSHDASRPFDVKVSEKTTVRALGTEFSVRRWNSERVDVIVSEGTVGFGCKSTLDRSTQGSRSWLDPASCRYVVTSGKEVRIVSGTLEIVSIGSDEVSRKLAWTRGMLGFNGQELGEVVAEFNRYNSVKLRIVDREVAQLRIGGYFRASNPEAFVRVLETHLGISASISTDNNHEIVIRRPARKR
jgi:transmembrane sensor